MNDNLNKEYSSDTHQNENLNTADNNFQETAPQEAAQKTLEKELEACRVAQEEWKDKFTRLSSDFDNFKRRTAREQAQWSELAQSKIITDLLEIVDDFDRAFEAQNSGDTKELLAGFDLIRTALHKLLTKWSVEPMKNYNEFNPEFHEALGQVASPEHTSGQIVQVLQQGYLFKGNVLRPARVIVAQ